jgi:hypothetical protein
VTGTAHFVGAQEKSNILEMRDKKYGIKAKMASLLSIHKGNYVVIAVQV